MSEATYICKDCGESFLWKDFGNDGYCKRCDPYEVVINHTDPDEKETALALVQRQLKRTEGKLIACEKALEVYRARDKQLEDILMATKGGD
jgi:ribosomal protein L44E